jgi:hypothetical protein
LLEFGQYLGNISFRDVVDIRAAGILDLFRIAAEPSLVVGVDPDQGEESTAFSDSRP